ncbi:hypothetical protein N24_0255 [Corynebacterium suranareeae]|uniref:Lipoprotein n=1 Tax=Corynebacterium suranareeae TaxID=2506452 RepID=A0A160PLC7_9CORY|nr:hypothetical protein [Corynebacterium suranareeae]BAU94517.1 hypothetical protein N24_0255 [Corynebacterium suranareeae]
MKTPRLLKTLSAMVAVTGLLAPTVVLATAADAAELSDNVPDRTQIAIINPDGSVQESDNAEETRPALSLAKLYLGYYVLGNGTEEDAELVPDMIRYSDDYTADYLESQYPEAIPEVIDAFDLEDTEWAGYWGNATTSVVDIATFVDTLIDDPIAQPLLDAMADTAEFAADGYAQNFGTYTLSDVTGTKFGWSDDLDVHASVSFGPGFVIAANTYGDAETLTEDVQDSVSSLYPEEVTATIEEQVEQFYQCAADTVQAGMHTGAELKEQLKGTTYGKALSFLPNTAPIPAFLYNLLAP